MSSTEIRTVLFAVTGCLLLATTACAPSGAVGEAQSTADTTASPSAEAPASADPGAPATVDGSFEFAAGASVGILAEPWNTTDEIDGVLLHQLPVKPGMPTDDAVWGDLIAYVPDVAYGSGTTEAEPVPADPVEWTLTHPDLEILDQREVMVDGVAATQIDARAKTETGWLAVEEMPFGWGGEERVVLVPLDGSWLVIRGSAFQPDVAFADDLPAGDGFSVMLESVELPD